MPVVSHLYGVAEACVEKVELLYLFRRMSF